MMASYDVIVIGGGFAGVTAARDLSDAGCSVCLVEARDRLAGRTWYRPFPGLDQKVEVGGSWVAPTWQPHVARELARYGMPLVQSPTPAKYVWSTGGELRSGFPVPLEDAMALERALHHVVSASHRIGVGLPLDHPSLGDLDVSVTDFFAPLDLSQATLDFLLGWVDLYSGAPAASASALNVLSWIAGFDNSAFALFGALSDKFSKGTTGMVETIAADSTRVEFCLSTPVRRVDQHRDGVVITTDTDQQIAAAVAVVALPVNVLNDIEWSPELSAPKQTMAAERHAGRSCKIWALVEGVQPNVVAVGRGGGLQWLSTEFTLAEGTLMVGLGRDPEELDVTSRDDIQRAIAHFLPGARVVATDAHDWNTDPYSRGTWMVYRPGQVRRLFSSLSQREGRLIFAGSDMATTWPGWIEGAIESGSRSATEALEFATKRETTTPQVAP